MKISVVTATYNAMQHLPALAESLRGQTDKDFEWVVADGASTDGTVEYLKSITDLNLKVISQEDFGIYDALNRGIKACDGEYYLVVGADDILYSDAIASYSAALKNDTVDIVTGSIRFGDDILQAGRGPAWLYASAAFVSGHAVGSVYRSSLHDELGYYTKKYPIAADQLFMLKAFLSGKRILKINSVIGEFNNTGISSVDKVGTITEIYRIMLELGFNKMVQTLLMFLRITKVLTKI